MGRILWLACLIVAICAPTGCVNPFNRYPDGRHHSNALDALFRRRHPDREAQARVDPAMSLARELTALEDDLRRDGTITVKTPDVWGDGNLIYYLQEYEALMEQRTRHSFSESLQAYIARSDSLTVQSLTGLSTALKGGGDDADKVDATAVGVTDATPIKPPDDKTKYTGIGLEPTEVARQHSTYIEVCQALRRRHLGDDNTRAAGYGLYKFRIPVSVLPGRETAEGWAGVVNLRAQTRTDEAHLRNTIRRLATADLVDRFALLAQKFWVCRAQDGKRQTYDFAGSDPANIPLNDLVKVYGAEGINRLIEVLHGHAELKRHQASAAPTLNELRADLFDYLPLVYNGIDDTQVIEQLRGVPAHAAHLIAQGKLDQLSPLQDRWQRAAYEAGANPGYPEISWMLAVHAGLIDYNLKKILRELGREGKVGPEISALAEPTADVYFYAPGPEGDVAQVLALWEAILKHEFPLHVFALDSQVEEQNVYDSLSRRRDLQVALAYSVAKGAFNMQKKLALSRQLGLDEAAIGLNRTVVGFSHGDDTFGWYFYPRVQAPPTESTNLGAFARTLWSTGPTEHYDLKHRKLEPGIRECEVLVAMPSFVHEVAFEVTSNWEKVAAPGVTKRSYEEMLAQGGRVHQLRLCLGELDDRCYRPGDLQRLVSRIDQLETMLGMQTHRVNIPYRYEQGGFDLFDRGNNQLRPSVSGVYGITHVPTKMEVQDDKCLKSAFTFFISGKNFHPTLTRVVVGGVEAGGGMQVGLTKEDGDSAGAFTTAVNVLSRELIQVRVEGLQECLACNGAFEVRVGTPQGLSNPFPVHLKCNTKNCAPATDAAPNPMPSAAPQPATPAAPAAGTSSTTFEQPPPARTTVSDEVRGPRLRLQP